jgi:4-aminobutyrate aminotransferase-like enzyme
MKKKYNLIGDVRGPGCIIGIELVNSSNLPAPTLASRKNPTTN